jgi:probable F420-dependent oxidoreductase
VSRRIKCSLTLNRPKQMFGSDLGRLVDAARIADDCGVDAIVLTDHVLIGTHTDRYPYGHFPVEPDEPWPDPVVTLAAIAAVTSRVRLSTGVLIATVRPAPLLAKMLATLDQLSRGRLDIGLGAGWQREEIEACGAPMQGLTSRLEDTVRACRLLWTGERVSFSSATVRFEDVWCVPTPYCPDGIPVWLPGAATERVAVRIAALADGWMPMVKGVPLEEVAAGIKLLREAYRQAGRDPDSVLVRAAVPHVADDDGRVLLGPTLEHGLPKLAEIGVSHAALSLGRSVLGPEDVRSFIEELGRRWQELAS